MKQLRNYRFKLIEPMKFNNINCYFFRRFITKWKQQFNAPNYLILNKDCPQKQGIKN